MYSELAAQPPSATSPSPSSDELPSIVISQAAIDQAPSRAAGATDSKVETAPRCPFWQVFGSTFVTIFLAELGDKTQVSTLLLSAEFHDPWVIFAGAGSALVATSLLGVLIGYWLAQHVSPRLLDKAAGLTLACLSAWLLWEVFQGVA